MNFYKRFIGDIQRDTGHLSCAEMGAYDRLLDHYYATEAPLPNDIDACCRIARAMTKDERKAVAYVLSHFFELGDNGYYQNRAEKELSEAQPKIEANRLNGAKGGRPKGTKNKTQEKPNGFLKETQNEPNDNLSQSHSQNITKLSNTQDNSTSVEPSKIANVCVAISEVYKLHNKPPTDIAQYNPTLKALVDAGASVEEFRESAIAAMQSIPQKGFSWILGRVKNQRSQALATVFAKGKVEPKEDLSWRNDDNQIYLKAQALKIHTTGKGRLELLAAIDKKREEKRTAA